MSIKHLTYDVVVIGGGPAGLAVAISAGQEKKSVMLIEREGRLGGILKQCVHDGFGIVRFNQRLTGTEYAERYIEMLKNTDVKVCMPAFVSKIEKTEGGFVLDVVSPYGVSVVTAAKIVLATGCRERTARQVGIHGTRPSGVFTAGTAQYYTNILGSRVAKKAVILGSGDIGLIMARRLTLEGSEVVGVFEIKPTPSGLTRNIHQCLKDFDIPLHLSHTVTRVFGEDRLTAVEVARVDESFNPIEDTKRVIECDALILSVGLIPENELAESLGARIDPKSKGVECDQDGQSSVRGVYTCGNASHVNDLVDYVSISGELAGRAELCDSADIRIEAGEGVLYVVPQRYNTLSPNKKINLCFRSNRQINRARVEVCLDGEVVLSKNYAVLLPPEMESLQLDASALSITRESKLEIKISEVQR